MNVRAIKTDKITKDSGSIYTVLDKYLPTLSEGSVVVVTSKIVSICEGRIILESQANLEDLIKQEAQYYLSPRMSKYGHHFTVAQGAVVASAGIDHSNGNGYFVLWPENPQKSANDIREYLKTKYGLKKIGVIIPDSTVSLLRRGTTGISVAHSGFLAVHNYIGSPDIFGRPFALTWSNIVDGLAAAAVVVMGEGAEQMPIAVIEDLDFVQFQDRGPIAKEIADWQMSMDNDLFAPFLTAVKWSKGDRAK